MEPGGTVTARQRLVHVGTNGLVFSLCYLLANALAQQRGTTRHIAFAWEAHTPFWPWMVLPYASSGILVCTALCRVPSQDGLRVLSLRLLLATVLAALVFVLWPLQFSGQRPLVDALIPAALFRALAWVDAPYNQFPSLHVAFCVLLWAPLRDLLAAPWARALLGGWLLLTALSTLFTYQHHVLDVVGGVLLGLVCLRVVRPRCTEAPVALVYLLTGGVAGVVGSALWPAALTLYLVASLWLVALAYARGNRHFLHKTQGRTPWWVCCMYAPYLLGYRLTWWAVVWRGRHHAPVRQITAQLWIGRRLRDAEAAQLPRGCTVFDLAHELGETPALRNHPYQHFPLLDIVAPPAAVVQDIMAALQRETAAGRCVYLHCAMGLRRSVVISNAFLSQNPTMRP